MVATRKAAATTSPIHNPGAAQEFQRIKLRQPIDERVMRSFRKRRDDKRFLKASAQAPPEHLREVLSVERDLLDRRDSEPRKHSPKEGCAPRPAGNEQQPREDRRVPERHRHDPVEENDRELEPGHECPGGAGEPARE
jgi:hypothetical protein